VARCRRNDHEGSQRRRHHDARPIRQFRAGIGLEDRNGGEQRHLLSRDAGVRPHLLERAGISAARRRERTGRAQSAYGLYAPPAGVVKPAGEWNTTRIIVDNAHVEHWLNGQKVVQYELWSPDWTAKVAASKFHAYPNYGMAKRGYIGIQGDHNGALWLRNIRIRALP
jgi:Domain of Unknown Function (DUF1080)